METNLTKTQQLLTYGLKQLGVSQNNLVSIILFLENEEDQILMIDFLIHHQQATEQEIMQAAKNILIRRKKLTETKESE